MDLDWKYCNDMLYKVSRTFALNIIRLKGNEFKAVEVGYLLFRMADTFEDTTYLSEDKKVEALKVYAEIFKDNKNFNKRLKLYNELKSLWQENSSEKDLINNGETVFKCYFELPDSYINIMDLCIEESVIGMIKFQEKKNKSGNDIYQIKDFDELEDYCYYVAGVVGKMLTGIFSINDDFKNIKQTLIKYDVQFGLALQITNILKDFSKDIDRGWCYIPKNFTDELKIDISQLSCLPLHKRIILIKKFLPRLISHFNDSLSYIKTIPKRKYEIREFCVIPFVLAYNTIDLLLNGEGVKISRENVKKILVKSKAFMFSNKLLSIDYYSFKIKNNEGKLFFNRA